jgi:ABC-2 type transport system permease protein
VIFGGMSAPAVVAGEGDSQAALDRLCFSLVLTLGLFYGYLFSGQAFLREKQAGILETLLVSPLSIRQIWAGKTLGVLLPAYALMILTAVLITGIAGAIAGGLLVPSLPIIFHIVLVIPVYIALATGVLGFVQLLLGMRENQIVNVAIIFLIILAITFAQQLVGPGFGITWLLEGVLFAGGILLFAVVAAATRLLDVERIIRTIP